MSDNDEVYPILLDSNNAAVSCSKSEEGDVATGQVGPTAFTYKDASGNLVLPSLNADGGLPVHNLDVALSTRASESTLLGLSGRAASIDTDIDVLLSTRASEATLLGVSGRLASLDTDVDVLLSTRASEATLLGVSGRLAAIDTDIDVALSTRASAANQTNGTQQTKITDGTNIAAVKAASTAAAATDPALVVTASPNSIQTVQGSSGTPGTPAGGILTIQGVSGGAQVAASDLLLGTTGTQATTTVGTTATQVPASPLSNRKILVLTANATGYFYGFSSGVTSANGIPLTSGVPEYIRAASTCPVYVIRNIGSSTVRSAETP